MDMVFMTVHAAGRQQANDMHRFIGADCLIDRIGQRRIGKKGAGLDRSADAGEFLIDNTTGAQIKVTHL